MKFDLLYRLAEKFLEFPGVGRKTAERFAFHILNIDHSKVEELIDIIKLTKEKVKNCRICNNLTENEICSICCDNGRDSSVICVVEEPKDLIAIEKTGWFRGRYFVLLGSLSPLDGIGVDDIKINSLFEHVRSHPEIKEVIISTDADAEGESTAHYILKIIKPLNRKITRIGMGLPVGADLEFIDRNTLQEALKGRREL
ncbi:MAG: recombination mediator RecR [Candidatus Omnitrophica bacterium]|nr:recombination mediator RecR [Candidatus Omnitrophota bacterium]